MIQFACYLHLVCHEKPEWLLRAPFTISSRVESSAEKSLVNRLGKVLIETHVNKSIPIPQPIPKRGCNEALQDMIAEMINDIQPWSFNRFKPSAITHIYTTVKRSEQSDAQ